MRVIGQTFKNDSGGMMATRELGIKNSAKIIYSLLTGMVQDKVGYPIRELATNAWEVSPNDVHIKLPGMIDPTFSVRDHGPGLTHHFMMHRFGTIGDSTKDEDENAIGGWGYGSKSPLAYLIREDSGAGSYTVRSFMDGRVRTYTIGMTSGGTIQIDQLDDSPTTEHSGLEVSFPVRREDIGRFAVRAKEILWSFNPRPKITPTIANWDEPLKPILSGPGFQTFDRTQDLVKGPTVRMGCVSYPINLLTMNASSALCRNDTLILFDVPIGSLSVQTSREGLSYNDRTQATLASVFKKFEKDVILSVQKQVDAEAKNWADACNIAYQAFYFGSHIDFNAMLPKVSYKGVPLKMSITLPKSMKCHRLGTGIGVERFAGHENAHVPIVSQYSGSVDNYVVEHRPWCSIARLKKLVTTHDLKGYINWIRADKADWDKIKGEFHDTTIYVLDDVDVDYARPRGKRHGKNMRVFHKVTVGSTGSSRPTVVKDLVDITEEHVYLHGKIAVGNREYRSEFRFKNGNGTHGVGLNSLKAHLESLIDLKIIPSDIEIQIVPFDADPPSPWMALRDLIKKKLFAKLSPEVYQAISGRGTSSYSNTLNPASPSWHDSNNRTFELINSMSKNPAWPKALSDLGQRWISINKNLDGICSASDNATVHGLIRTFGLEAEYLDEVLGGQNQARTDTLLQKERKEIISTVRELQRKFPLLNAASADTPTLRHYIELITPQLKNEGY